MRRRLVVALLLAGGCSTNPVADVYDWVCPARGVCSRANASPVGAVGAAGTPGAAAEPACAAALKENQNYRRGLLERFRRSRSPATGVPPATAVPPAGP